MVYGKAKENLSSRNPRYLNFKCLQIDHHFCTQCYAYYSVCMKKKVSNLIHLTSIFRLRPTPTP